MAALLSFVFLLLLIGATSASTSPIGVTYNPLANSQGRQLEQVANRLQSLGITSVRLSAGDPFVLQDFSFSNISILLTVPNHLVPALAANRSYAASWLASDVIRYYTRTRISAISVGSDVLDANAKLIKCLLPAIRNVRSELDVLGIRGILVSTSFSFINTLTTAIPPSAAEFQEPAGGLLIKPLLDFLQETNSSFLISLHPYELYRVSPEIPLGFALFRESLFGFLDDPQTGNRYWNLYDTMIDAVVTAMSVAGHKNIPLVVVETGWPSSGSQASEADANPVYAEMFLRGLVADQFFNFIDGKKPENANIIVSSHSTPSLEEIGNLVARIQATGADIVKIATTAQDITDSARVFQVLANSQVPVIGLVMGDKGLISRILCAKYGGFLTFGSLEAGAVSAPGQPTIKDLLDLYNFRQIGPDTKVHGVIGNPIGHSKSPHLYNPSFKSIGFDGIYLPLLVDSVANFLETYSSPDFVGYSVTIPHKEAGLKCCDEVDPIAQAIGAISCMIRSPTDGKLIGYNNDYQEAIAAIEEGLQGSNGVTPAAVSPLAGKLFVVIGAGGAGKALAYGGRAKGARVVVVNRTYEKAKELAGKVDGKAITLSELNNFHPEEGMILANTTSVGMKPRVEDTPITKDAPKHYSLVFDAVYTPKLTRLLKEAQESGAIFVYGTEMFIKQASVQFEKFTGLPAPKKFIRELLASLLPEFRISCVIKKCQSIPFARI